MPDSSPLVRPLEIEIAASGATATTSGSERVPFAGVVQAVRLLPLAAVTGAASPASRTYTLVNRGQDGNGSTAVATLALTSGVNLVAFDERAVPLSGTAANLNVAEGDVLELRSAAVGATGLADGGATAIVEIARA
jgi:hypothetical protein